MAGPFVVPAGVRLQGRGAHSVITAANGVTAVTLVATTARRRTTELRQVAIVSDGLFGVLVTGSGRAGVRQVGIAVTRGVGIGGENITSGDVRITDVHVAGPVNEANANDWPVGGTGDTYPTHGIVFRNAGSVDLDHASASGFLYFGALFIGSDVSWDHGRATSNIEGGAVFHGGTATLDDLDLSENLHGNHPAFHTALGLEGFPVGGGFMAGVAASTEDLRADGNDGAGLFHDHSGVVEHEDLEASGNELTAVWSQDSAGLEIEDSALVGNGYAGVVAINGLAVEIEDTEIEDSFAVAHDSMVGHGDGVVSVHSNLDLDDVELEGNARAGVVYELSPVTVTFTGVRVRGGTYGVVGQSEGAPLPMVTTGVNRGPSLTAADSVFSSSNNPLVVAGAVQPCFLPAAQMVAVSGLSSIFSAALSFSMHSFSC